MRVLLFVTFACICVAGVAKAGQSNVLFSAIDVLRTDLGACGIKRAITPNLDRLASEVRLFNPHYVQVPTCGPSRAGTLTGINLNATPAVVTRLMSTIQERNNGYLPRLANANKQTTQSSLKEATSKTRDAKAKSKGGKPTAKPTTPTWTDAASAAKESPAFAFLGEYLVGGKAIQVVPVEGRYYLSIYQGGLPGAGWDGKTIKHEWIEADKIEPRLKGLTKIDRSAKLEFTKPPEGATVLFDGTDMKQWAHGKIKDGLLQAGAKTKKSDFQDFRLHFETLIPFKPELPLAHPGRGNSGVFALGAYEVQVCDTFGVDFAPDRWEEDGVMKHPDTWCGGIYGIRAANVNMCLPPLAWQTFDLEFTAARFEDEAKVSDARLTVHQNGVLIHGNVVVPEGTGGGPKGPRPEVSSGPIMFQKHGNPTQYRNIWIVPR